MHAPTSRETAGLTTKLIVEHVRVCAGESGVARLLERAGVACSRASLEDERTWHSYAEMEALFAAAADVTGDQRVGFGVGRRALASGAGSGIKLLLRSVGSPRRLLRILGRVVSRFTTCAVLHAEEVGRRHAVLSYRLHPGYTPSSQGCGYTQGLLTQIPVLFGLPPAHIEHPACMLDGAPACRYELTWRARSWNPWRRRATRLRELEDQLAELATQLAELQHTGADLTSADDTEAVIGRIAARAATSVHAHRHLLAVRLGAHVHVRSSGFADEDATALARTLLEGADPGDKACLVAPIVSAQRDYGVLAAFLPAGQTFLAVEHNLFEAYGRMAAAALDLATAMEGSRRREHTATALLEFAGSVAQEVDEHVIAEAVAKATRQVAGAERASVFLLEPATSLLRVCGTFGWPAHLRSAAETYAVPVDAFPEIAAVLASTRVSMHRLRDASPQLQRALTAFDTETAAAVPIRGGETTLGVIVAGFTGAPAGGPLLVPGLEGLGHLAATAFTNARLVRRIQHQATHDALTGLPNQLLFSDRLNQALQAAYRSGEQLAVAFCDLDRFKTVNDTLGHSAGDELLVQVARRLGAVVRSSDSVARLGGDEFTLLLSDVRGPAGVREVADRVLGAFAEPFLLAGRSVRVTASLGLALSITHGSSAEELLKHADAAMYDAKRLGGARWQLFEHCVMVPQEDRLQLEADLHDALSAGSLAVVYQPQLELRSRMLTGLEALVRWVHPAHGLLMPSAFIQLAEDTGLIVDLDLHVLGTVCRQARAWLDAGHAVPRTAVNVSGRTLTDPRFLPALEAALERSGLPAHLLELEITETSALQDPQRVLQAVRAIKRRGCTLAIDDLGTGYGVLSWLQEWPVDRVKIDRSFIAGIVEPGDDAPVVAGVTEIARRLGLSVLAEGVETEVQAAFLVEHECTEAQGFLLSMPLPADAVTAHLPRTAETAGAA